MANNGSMVEFPSNGGTGTGYFAPAGGGTGPGVVVIQEGVTLEIKPTAGSKF